MIDYFFYMDFRYSSQCLKLLSGLLFPVFLSCLGDYFLARRYNKSGKKQAFKKKEIEGTTFSIPDLKDKSFKSNHKMKLKESTRSTLVQQAK